MNVAVLWLLTWPVCVCVQVFHNAQQEQKQGWLKAHLFCTNHGANLLSISGHEEEQFILQILHEEFGWVGTSAFTVV